MPSIQAITAYIPTEWFDNTAPAINGANLNHIEQGIKNATDEVIALTATVDALTIRLDALELAPPAHTHVIGDVTGLQTELDGKPDGSWSRSGTTLNIDITGS